MVQNLSKEIKLIFYVIGLYSSFVYWGFLQEKITATKYTNVNDGHSYNWQYPFALNVFMGLATFVMAVIGDAMSTSSPSIPIWVFAKPAITCAIASPIGYIALDYISFPLVVLTKSSKPVPVMLVGVLLYGRKYPWYKYVSVLLLCGGIALFSFSNSSKPGKEIAALTQLIGICLVLVNLFLDGYTNNHQDYIFKHYEATSLQMMKYVNLWQVVYLVGYLTVCYVLWGEDSEAANAYKLFLGSAPLRYDVLMFCVCASVGQLFIFATMKEFGSLTWVTLSITRKLFTIIVSIVMFNHTIVPLQGLGIVSVFAGMVLEVAMSYLSRPMPKDSMKKQDDNNKEKKKQE